jgi:OOP family OmpA-OmpF porin
MNKLALSAAVAALALSPVLSQAAHADDAGTVAPRSPYGANINPSWQDNFFVAGQLGQTQFRGGALGGMSHDHSVFQNVRFGWRWNGIVGPEIGYAYLGRPKTNEDGLFSFSTKARALTLGLNAKYNVYDNWFVTAHAGYLRAQMKDRFDLAGLIDGKATNYNNGWYGGLGVGYDLTRNFSVGLNYDNYHINDYRANVAAYSASVEYRF